MTTEKINSAAVYQFFLSSGLDPLLDRWEASFPGELEVPADKAEAWFKAHIRNPQADFLWAEFLADESLADEAPR